MNTKTIIRIATVTLALGGCDSEEGRDAIDDTRANGTCADESSAFVQVAYDWLTIYGDAQTGGYFSPFADMLYDSGGCSAGDLSQASLEAIRSTIKTEISGATLKTKTADIGGVAKTMGDYQRAGCEEGVKECNLDDQWASDIGTMAGHITTINTVLSYLKDSVDNDLVGTKEVLAAASLLLAAQHEEFLLRNLQGQTASWDKFKGNACDFHKALDARFTVYATARDDYATVHEEVAPYDEDDEFFFDWKYYYYVRPNGDKVKTEKLDPDSPKWEAERELFDTNHAKELESFELSVVGGESQFNKSLSALSDICSSFEPMPIPEDEDQDQGEDDGGGDDDDANGDPHAGESCGKLQSGSRLESDEEVKSCDGRFTLRMQGDGNLTLKGDGTLWKENTKQAGSYVVMQNDGNLVLYTADGEKWWSSGTDDSSGAYLRVTDGGNLVVYTEGGGKARWESGTSEG